MKNKIILSLIFLNLFGCKKDEFEIVNLNGNSISILGHGGMGIGHTYPMNSFESIACCLNLGADGTEIDVEMTKDGVLAAFHDLELSDRTNIAGIIYAKNWDEISHALYKDPIYTGYKIVSLDHILSGLENKNERLFLFDCKNFNPDTSKQYRTAFCNALIEIIDKYQIRENVIIEFKREDLITTLISMAPGIKIFVYADFEKGFTLARKYQVPGIVISMDEISKEQVRIAHEHGLQVAVFNVDSNKKNREAVNKNVDMIETGNLKHLMKILK